MSEDKVNSIEAIVAERSSGCFAGLTLVVERLTAAKSKMEVWGGLSAAVAALQSVLHLSLNCLNWSSRSEDISVQLKSHGHASIVFDLFDIFVERRHKDAEPPLAKNFLAN